jgi:integrase
MTGNGITKRRPIKRAAITKRRVDALQPGESLVDDEVRGFVVRRPKMRRPKTGSIAYGLRYSIGGQQKWLSLGLHGRLTPQKARALAKQRAGEIAAGRDPVAEQAAKKQAALMQVTLGSVVPIYIEDRKAEFRPTVLVEQKRYLERYWKPLHDVSIGDVRRKNVVAVIDNLAKIHGRVAADRARTSLSAFFSWAIDRGYCDATPVINIKARNQNGSRSRVLTEAQLVEVWRACLDDDYGRIVKLLILTAQRKSEIGNLDYREINTSDRLIELQPTRTKNGRAHLIPLSDEALAILKSASRRKDRDFVFGRGAGGFSGWSRAKADLDKRIRSARKDARSREPIAPWVIHDIRRSVVTHLHERGFAQPHVVEAIVNHVSGHQAGVAGVYNKAVYLAERRRALDMWSDHIAALTAGRESNVVALPSAAKSA